jgi:lipid A ethanolaminephosphotransferase
MKAAHRPRAVAPIAVTGAASLAMATLGNIALWLELAQTGLLHDAGGFVLAGALAAFVAAVLFALLSLLAWPRVLKPMVAVLVAVTVVGAYFMTTLHVVIDRGMVHNVLQTDWHEARALVGPQLVTWLLAGVVLPLAALRRLGIRRAPFRRQLARNLAAAALALLAAAALVLLSFQPLSSAMRNHKQLRYLLNPLNTLYASGGALAGGPKHSAAVRPLGRDARIERGGQPPLVMLVLGETGRSGNFGVNGYARDTTPELARAGVASFRNAWSCGTSTAASVPCMFSHLGREGFGARSEDWENLLDVLRNAGVAVLWVDNQAGGCKGVCDRVTTVNTSTLVDPVLCAGGECLDGVMLEGLEGRLAALPAAERERGVVVVLHQIGSHGPAYWRRSPPSAKRFLPECTSSHLPDCGPEELRNAYDNSIAYTDQFLGSAIRWLERQAGYDTALVYVADHGESLGENNLYLHGLPWAIAPDVQKHVPWVTWLSPAFEKRSGVTLACLRGQAQRPLTHDHLFHSMLGVLQVSTAAYRRGLDAYADCAAH